MIVTGAVEGFVDEAILGRVVAHAGLSLGTVYGRKGKSALLQYIKGYNNAARFSPWVVLIDLNGDFGCAPDAIGQWLPNQSEKMFLRVAVRTVEAWVLADHQRVAQWLGIPHGKIPADPDALEHPKQELINLARRSRRRDLKRDLVPREGSGRATGPLYAARVTEFIQDRANGWRPSQALRNSDSLNRCVVRLRHFARNQA